MPHQTGLLLTVAVAIGAAFCGGMVARWFRLPPILGYMAAGIVIGPFTPGWVGDTAVTQELAEIGVILLMFAVGLHFSLRELVSVRGIAMTGALLQVGVATVATAAGTVLFGGSLVYGVVLGVSVSVASTVVLLRALLERGLLETQAGKVAVGWLIVEDLFIVVVLVVMPTLPALSGSSPEVGPVLGELALTAGKVVVLGALMLVVGTRVVPWLLRAVGRTGSRELFTLAILAIALGIAVGSSLGFGVTFALGAFLAGLTIGESEFSQRAAEDALPFRDTFAALFFVSVGMLFDPSILITEPAAVAGLTAVVLLVKPVVALLVARLLRQPLETGLVVAVGLAQVGEFSFIVAGLGLVEGLLPVTGYNLVLAAAIISIAVNPFAFRLISRWMPSTARRELPLPVETAA